MLVAYNMRVYYGDEIMAETADGKYSESEFYTSPQGWVRYEDAQALELRIAELEQQLKTPEQKRAEFEEDCEREP